MNFLDILTLVAFVWAVVAGWRSGFVAQLLSLVGIVAGVMLAASFGSDVGVMLGVKREFAAMTGFIVTFVVAMIAATVLSKLLRGVLSFMGLKSLDTLFGVLISVVKALIVLSLAYMAFEAMNSELKVVDTQYLRQSYTYDLVRGCARPVVEYLNAAKEQLLGSSPITI